MSRFITLEGSEGAGKTSALEVIESVLNGWGVEYIQTREPGGEANAESIREILLHSEHLHAQTELLLMFAARNEHVQKVIRPALFDGVWVVSDRFVDASYAYQGQGREIGWKTIQQLEDWVVGSTQPDLTLYLDVDPEVGLQRAAKRSGKDRIEKESLAFFKQIRRGYQRRCEENPERIRVIDANQPQEQVLADIKAVLDEHKEQLLS